MLPSVGFVVGLDQGGMVLYGSIGWKETSWICRWKEWSLAWFLEMFGCEKMILQNFGVVLEAKRYRYLPFCERRVQNWFYSASIWQSYKSIMSNFHGFYPSKYNNCIDLEIRNYASG